jgi:small-conductance mechanosensitive channel
LLTFLQLTATVWLSPTFWNDLVSQTVTWLIPTLPSLLIIAILAFILLKVTNLFLRRIKPIMLKYMESGSDLDTRELEKRLDTLHGILRSIIKVIIWVMVGMLVLRKIGIDIAKGPEEWAFYIQTGSAW